MIEPDDGPTDKQVERAGERYSESADATIRAMAVVAPTELLDLITTYGEDEARKLLGQLRERFWADDQVQAATDRIIANLRESDGEPD